MEPQLTNTSQAVKCFLEAQRAFIMAIENEPHLLSKGLCDIWTCTTKIAEQMDIQLLSRQEILEIAALQNMFDNNWRIW